MATERQLRKRINDLTKEIESLKTRQRQLQNELGNLSETRLKEFQQKYERELVRLKRETEEEYIRRITKFQNEYITESQRQIAMVKQQAESVLREQNEKINELEQCNAELRNLLKRIRDNTEEVGKNHRIHASALMEQVQRCRSITMATPHEFFYDGEFNIIDEHAQQIPSEIQNGMYQAAAADANSVMLEFELLKTKVEQSLEEWLAAFEDYRIIVYDLNNRIDQLEKHSLQSVAGTFNMQVNELDFWSSNTYLPFKTKIKKAFSDIKEIEEKGIVKHLKNCKSSNRKGIFSMVSDANKWMSEFSGIVNCILSERLFSDERWAYGQATDDLLKQVGYKAERKSFRKRKSQPVQNHSLANPLDSFDVIETIQGKDRIMVTFCPVRNEGVTVRNECIVSAFPQTLCNKEFVDQSISIAVERIKTLNDNLSVVGIPFGNCSVNNHKKEELQRKKQPNPQERIRSLEKKHY